MAGDTWMPLLGSSNGSDDSQPGITSGSASTLRAEGEDANDLVAFAKALTDSGTRLFSTFWSPVGAQQKALFQDGAQFLPFVELSNPDRTLNSVATSEGIVALPGSPADYLTWEFPNGSRLSGLQTLQTLATSAAVAIPQSSRPSFQTIPNVNVGIGSPVHIPVDAYDPNGNPLTVTVTSSNPSVLTAQVLSGNRSVRFAIQNFGDLTFELFEDKAPRPTGRLIELAQDGFFNKTNTNTIGFHRVINNFVVQGGDPTGTGAGGSTLGDFDDQFHVDLQHNRTGVLSYAKSTDDTNDSQFFITEGPQRFLDFNHSIFGQLVEGELVREAISNVATGAGDKPTVPVVINTATVFDDNENSLLMLKAAGNTTGTSDITVTVTDSEGNSTSQTFRATVIQDTANGGPFLNDFQPVRTAVNTPVNVPLTSQDVEGDPVTYTVQKVGNEDYTVSVNATTGVATVTPGNNFVGPIQFRATVAQTTATTTNDKSDVQLVTVIVGPSVPTSIDLDAASDSGVSNSDNITNAQSLSFVVAGTIAGATVELKVGNNVIGSATASGTTTTVVANNLSGLGQGPISVVATQTTNNQTSEASPSLNVTLDNQSPAALASGAIPGTAQINQALSVNLAHAEEGQGLSYTLTNAPAGMTLNASTGQLDWTPTSAQTGANTFSLLLTDAAGNVRTESVTITVTEAPKVRISLQAVSASGTPITQVAVGDTFKVRVLLEDLRGFGATGVFATYVDVLFDSTIIEPIATNPISHPDPYTNDQSGTTTTAGLIDELGAFSATTSRLGADPRILSEITFTAKASGNPNLRTESPDDVGNDILLFDETAAVPFSRVSFGASNVVVGANFTLVNDLFNFDEDSGAHALNVLNNDTTSGGAVLTIASLGTTSQGGTVSIAPGGTAITYTSASNFNGSETFTYTAKNQSGLEQTATVTIQLTDVNDPPVAVNDVASVAENSSGNAIQVLTNDTQGVDTGETLRVTAVGTGSAGGTIQIGSSGLNVLYTPQANFKGTETFTYTLSDGRSGTASGTVSVNVAVTNPPPAAANDTFAVAEDAAETTYDVLANDTTDNVSETLDIQGVGTASSGGVVSVSTDRRSLRYRPASNFNGTETVTYTLRDSGGATATGTVTFTVTAVNDSPEANDDTVELLSSASAQTVSVLTNDRSVDSGETLTITAVTQPPTGSGTVAIATDGKSILYTAPSATFEGNFSFDYTLGDGSALNDVGTVNIKLKNFTPRDIGGVVTFEDSLLVSQSTSSRPVGGFPISLAGVDYQGDAVSKSTTVDVDGSFAYTSLPPGNYTISRDALPFLHDAPESMAITSAFDAGNSLNNTAEVGGLQPQFFDIRDFLGSTPRNSLTVAVSPGAKQNWYSTRGNWTGFKNLEVSLNSAGDSLTVTAVNSSNQNVSATLPVSGGNTRVTQHGQDSSLRLLRIAGSAADIGFQPVTTASSTTGSGEGEGVSAVSPAAIPLGGTPRNASNSAAPLVTGAGVPAQGISPTQAIRALLGSSRSSQISNSPGSRTLAPQAVDIALAQADAGLTETIHAGLDDTLNESSGVDPAAFDSVLAAF